MAAENVGSTADHSTKLNWTATLKKSKKKPIRVGLVNTVKEFTLNSSVHGIGYIFETGIPLVDSFFWALISLASLSLALYMSVDAYLEWQAKPTITTLANSSVPATEVTFPAITICRDGVDMNAVEEAIFEDFTKWKQSSGRTSKSKKEDEDLLHEYMAETYKVSGKRNIFDLVKAHLSPDISESNMNGAILDNLNACQKKEDHRRKKRSTSESEEKEVEEISNDTIVKEETKREKRNTNEELLKTVTFLLSDMGNLYYKVEVKTSEASLSPGLINSTCQNVGMLPVCSTNVSPSTSTSEACMLTTVSQTTFVNAICNSTTTTSCQGSSNTFLFSEATIVCLEEALGASGSCGTSSSQTLQTSFALCVTPTGECYT